VESEHVCVGLEGRQTKSSLDPRFGPAGDEELDKGNLVHIAGEHGEKCGCRFLILVLALVKGVDDDESLDLCRLERFDNESLHLRTEDLPSDIRVCPQDLEQLLSEWWMPIGKLEGECREDHLNVAPVLEIP